MEVLVRRLPGNDDLPLPERASEHAAGFDLRAALSSPLEIAPGGRALVPTGLSVALPPDHEAQVRPRSGLALRRGVTLLNAPGTIDADYRGEIGVILINHGSDTVQIARGDRIAQLVVQRIPRVRWVATEELPETVRGDGGFGHTGDR